MRAGIAIALLCILALVLPSAGAYVNAYVLDADHPPVPVGLPAMTLCEDVFEIEWPYDNAACAAAAEPDVACPQSGMGSAPGTDSCEQGGFHDYIDNIIIYYCPSSCDEADQTTGVVHHFTEDRAHDGQGWTTWVISFYDGSAIGSACNHYDYEAGHKVDYLIGTITDEDSQLCPNTDRSGLWRVGLDLTG